MSALANVRNSFAGAMLDTADKTRGALPDHLSVQRLTDFIAQARQLGLMTGLAGSVAGEVQPDLSQIPPIPSCPQRLSPQQATLLSSFSPQA